MQEGTSQQDSGMSRYLVLIGAIVVQLILGTVYGYSIFWQPLQSELGLAQEHANYAFAICILSFALVMVIAGRVQDVTGPRLPAIIGACLMGGGFILASFMNSPIVLYLAHAAFTGMVCLVILMLYQGVTAKLSTDEYPILKYVPYAIVCMVLTAGVILGTTYVGNLGQTDQLFLLWGTVGLLAGAGIGFAYVCPIAALVKWFPKHKGLVAGLAVAGFGFGAFIFSNKSIPFSAENYIQTNGIAQLFFAHGLVCLVTIIVGALMLKNPPTVAAAASTAGQEKTDSGWQTTLRDPAFYLLWLMFFSGAMAGLMVIGILKPFAGGQLLDSARETQTEWVQTTLTEVEQAKGSEFQPWLESQESEEKAAQQWIFSKGAAAVGWLAIFNAVGRILWGFASDRIGRTKAFIAMFSLQAVVLLILGMLKTELTLAVGASLVGFNFGGNFALFPSATADLFGAKNLGANYGWVFTSYGIAGVVGIAAGNAAMKMTQSYSAAFIMAAVLCCVSVVLALSLQKVRPKLAAA